MSDPAPFPCPRCGRSLAPAGEVTTDDGRTLPVFQCDECVLPDPEVGVDMAYTFAIDEQGRVVDPAHLD